MSDYYKSLWMDTHRYPGLKEFLDIKGLPFSEVSYTLLEITEITYFQNH